VPESPDHRAQSSRAHPPPQIRPVVKELGLTGVTFHCLRHTAASLLIRTGTPVTTASEILGHASRQMTLDVYGHYYEGEQGRFMAQYETILEGGTEQERNEGLSTTDGLEALGA